MAKDDEDFGALLEEFEKKGGQKRPGGRRHGPALGDVVRGRVFSVGREVVFVTLSDGTTEGVLDLEELRNPDGTVSVAPGDEVEARVAELGEKSGHVVLRRTLRAGSDGRDKLEQAFALGLPVEGTIAAVNKGGVEVTIGGVRGFCPMSQLDLRPVADPAVLVGQKHPFRITRLETDARGLNLVVSRRALLEEDAQRRAQETRKKLVVGAVLPGVVTAIKDFGAFVDLGGIEGMLPASELGFSRSRPNEVLTVGQALEVQILRIEATSDPKRPERLSLSLKSLAVDPFTEAEARFPAGTQLTGKVTRVESFGAFVELEPGVEGLLHVSQLGGDRHLHHARQAVSPGAEVEVVVLSFDRERRRISLGAPGADAANAADAADLAAARSDSGKLGTLGDLLKGRLR